MSKSSAPTKLKAEEVVEEKSPRSAILTTATLTLPGKGIGKSTQQPQPYQQDSMTTAVVTMNEKNALTEAPANEKIANGNNSTTSSSNDTPIKASNNSHLESTPPKPSSAASERVGSGNVDKQPERSTPLPNNGQFAVHNAAGGYLGGQQLSSQFNSGYYINYAEPPSPGISAGMYDPVGSFFQQTAVLPPHGNNSPFPPTPLSPPRPTTASAAVMGAGGIPPPSPLFPRSSANVAHLAPPSPNLAYMSPPLTSSMYQSYPLAATQNMNMSNSSPEDAGGWDRQNYSAFQSSPHTQPLPMYGIPNTRQGRTYSFDEMLPPSMLEHEGSGGSGGAGGINPAYSPYNSSQASSANAAGPWSYASVGTSAPPEVMYGLQNPGSPLQPRNTVHPGVPMPYMAANTMRPMGQYNSYFPATSPGPPIQTTTSNKGPDGANLFIFHIPNHFTNMDMFQLFCPYGNLLSVRIMVEKDTGRSRGFGFVSYDSPESAALAIKQLNGFAIGNKRLKVQHKQIRPRDMNDRDDPHDYVIMEQPNYRPAGTPFASANLPPSGAASQSLWYDRKISGEAEEGVDGGGPVPGPPPPAVEGIGSSPLTTLGSLQAALPDVTGNGPNE